MKNTPDGTQSGTMALFFLAKFVIAHHGKQTTSKKLVNTPSTGCKKTLQTVVIAHTTGVVGPTLRREYSKHRILTIKTALSIDLLI